ncbi:hypothetical protein BRC82_06120 [Halobacteriales archaeon QS_1_67_19]|nr:MAG: hypothetical protein BRC82_06120 [Halobacteriales archaeon QS_1_67_19]
MPVSGYDPEDLDDTLSNLLAERDPSNWLSDEEIREWENGASPVELLDEEDIHDLLRNDAAATEEGDSAS